MSDDFYYDDPIEENYAPRRKAPMVLAMLLLAVTGSFFLKTTLAANISISTGVAVEFGQGVAVTSACSGASILTMRPNGTFINGSGAGGFYLSSVTVSGIPSSCYGADFTISAFASSGNAPLPIFNTSATSAVIYDNSGTFTIGHGAAGTLVTSGSGSFTVTFASPVALASSVAKLSLQSASHSPLTCTSDGVCSLGDTGPGGGTVYYYNAAGFNCGPSFNATGSPTGGLCHYLEAAPATWQGGSDHDHEIGLVPPAIDSVNIPNLPRTAIINSTSELGLGYSYTNIIVAASPDLTYGAGRTRTYRGGGLSDWYLPDTTELNQLCKYVSGQPWTSDATVCTGSANPTLGIVLDHQYWASSGNNQDGHANVDQFMGNGSQSDSYYSWAFEVRAIRAF